ncbi:hypothetical protein [Butyricimonas synergistica]|uniref:hypothetical protein n=1 Tax=Butyricimonas synergistica TaxID=544644 RepID=UPI000374DF2F|nr:hypothetical protein [Butyricimonas synergistica]
MRTRNILPACLLVLLSGEAFSQVKVENSSVKKQKRDVEVRFEIRETPGYVRSRQKMVLRPYLYSGVDTLWLAPAQLYGKIRYKRERQEQTLAGNRDWTLEGYNKLKGATLVYAESARYERWMKSAGLGIAYHLEGCGCECCDGDQVVPVGPVYVAPEPEVIPVTPAAKNFEVLEAKKRWNFREEMKVFFPVSKTVLHADKYGNQKTLDDIIAGIREIGDREKLRLQGVEITGFASPEGGVALNTRLGEGRARALKDYVQKELPDLRDEDFVLVNGVENWDGLRQLVAASDMEYRDEVLGILDDASLGAGRKTALMKLAGGKPYRYMLKEFYPGLRNACYVSVFYDVLGDKAADAVNAANELIRAGKYAEALKMLEPYKNDDRTFNSIGVCYMMMEEEEIAIEWFEKAIRAGHAGAEKNLQQIK